MVIYSDFWISASLDTKLLSERDTNDLLNPSDSFYKGSLDVKHVKEKVADPRVSSQSTDKTWGKIHRAAKPESVRSVEGSIRGIEESRSVSVESGDPGRESITVESAKCQRMDLVQLPLNSRVDAFDLHSRDQRSSCLLGPAK